MKKVTNNWQCPRGTRWQRKRTRFVGECAENARRNPGFFRQCLQLATSPSRGLRGKNSIWFLSIGWQIKTQTSVVLSGGDPGVDSAVIFVSSWVPTSDLFGSLGNIPPPPLCPRWKRNLGVKPEPWWWAQTCNHKARLNILFCLCSGAEWIIPSVTFTDCLFFCSSVCLVMPIDMHVMIFQQLNATAGCLQTFHGFAPKLVVWNAWGFSHVSTRVCVLVKKEKKNTPHCADAWVLLPVRNGIGER